MKPFRDGRPNFANVKNILIEKPNVRLSIKLKVVVNRYEIERAQCLNSLFLPLHGPHY